MARKFKADFTDVEAYTKCEEGQHVVVVKEINEKEADSGNDMLVVKFEVVKGDSKGAIVYNNFVLTETSLWRLKAFFEAIGVKADGRVAVDLDKLIGKKLIIEVGHEEYNGQTRARVNELMPLGGKKEAEPEDDEDEEEDEKPAKKAPAKGKKKPEPEPEDDDDDDDEEEEDEPPAKKKAPAKKPAKAPAKGKKKPADDDDDDDDWDED